MLRRTVLLSVLLLTVTATAHANVWTDAQAQTAIRAADAHWPSSPCHGRERITWIRGAELDMVVPGHFTGMAQPDCGVLIAWDRVPQTPAWLCTVLEHEFGHLAGHEHSDDPHDVMYWITRDTTPECRAAFRTNPRRFWRLWRQPIATQ